MPCLTGFNSVPERLINDAQIRDLLNLPVSDGVEPRNPFAGIWMLGIAEAIPDAAANIEFVVKNACAADRITIDGVLLPMAGTGATPPEGR